MRFVFILALTSVVGCSTIEADERERLDWKVELKTKEKCVPYYGTLICGEDTRPKYTCILYEEPKRVKE